MSSDEILIELLVQLQKAPPDDARAILNSQPQIAYEAMTLMVKMGAVDVQTFVKRLESYGVSASSRTPAIPPTHSSLPPHVHPSRAAQMSVPSGNVSYADPNAMTSGPPHQQPGPDMYGRRNNAPYSQNPRSAQYSPGPPNAYQQPPPNLYQQGPLPQSYQQVPPSTSFPPRGPNSHDFNSANQYGRQESGPPHSRRPPDNYGRHPSAPSHANMGPPPGPEPSRPPTAPPQSLPPGMLDQFPPEQKAMIQHVISMSADDIQRLPPNERNNIMQIRTTLGLPPT